VSYYARNLPHWQPEGAPLFVTWRLFGSLPRTGRDYSTFTAYETQLDAAGFGPTWLSDDRIAQVVVDALAFRQTELKLYELMAWVIMPNHVHIVVDSSAPVAKITKAIKNFTAKRANEILDRTGQPFWQYESYDHWVRDRYELPKVIGYVESNPVKAGFVDRVENWRWSSAYGMD
jgi:REP element-mobilizing transposase RayT